MNILRTVVSGGLFVIPVTITFTDKVACFSQVIGVSMQPSINPNYSKGESDWLLQNKMVVARNKRYKLERGDIVTFITPYNPQETAVKRIVGLEGDIVKPRNECEYPFYIIPKGCMWVEGENSSHSRDSTNYGPVSMSLITSKVTHIIWPPSRWQKLDSVEIDRDRVRKDVLSEITTCKIWFK